jgi:hypothetical protein
MLFLGIHGQADSTKTVQIKVYREWKPLIPGFVRGKTKAYS